MTTVIPSEPADADTSDNDDTVPLAVLRARSAAAAPPALAVTWGAVTDRGLRRRINEDSMLADPPVFLVADGMGGHDAGEVASALAVESFAHLGGRSSVDTAQIRDCFDSAQRRISAIEARSTAGTTVSGLAVTAVEGAGYWLVFNLGDSRSYRLRAGGALEQVSVDHSVVQELVEAGELAPEDVRSHPQRNVITRALGAGEAAEPDFWLLPAEPADRMLVCSDGLTTELDDERIELVLRSEPDPRAAAVRLVQEALDHGGRDNITVVIVDADAGGDDESTASASLDEIERTLPRPEGDTP